MSDKIFLQLKKRYDEVYAVTPNELHNSKLTWMHKFVGQYLKVFPFRVVVPISIIATLLMYVVLGILVIRVVSILQYGF